MDLYCPICGEPWALDALHDVPDAGFDVARRRFRTEGCALLGSPHNRPIDGATAAKSALLPRTARRRPRRHRQPHGRMSMATSHIRCAGFAAAVDAYAADERELWFVSLLGNVGFESRIPCLSQDSGHESQARVTYLTAYVRLPAAGRPNRCSSQVTDFRESTDDYRACPRNSL